MRLFKPQMLHYHKGKVIKKESIQKAPNHSDLSPGRKSFNESELRKPSGRRFLAAKNLLEDLSCITSPM